MDIHGTLMFPPLSNQKEENWRRLRESWPFRHIEKKGELFQPIFLKDFFNTKISPILESLKDCV